MHVQFQLCMLQFAVGNVHHIVKRTCIGAVTLYASNTDGKSRVVCVGYNMLRVEFILCYDSLKGNIPHCVLGVTCMHMYVVKVLVSIIMIACFTSAREAART